CFFLSLFIFGHFGVGRLQVRPHYVWPDQFLNKLAYFTVADSLVKTLIDFFVNGYSKLLLHCAPPYTCTIRLITGDVNYGGTLGTLFPNVIWGTRGQIFTACCSNRVIG